MTETNVTYSVKELLKQQTLKMELMHKDINDIKVQTKLTNGRVNFHDKLIYVGGVLFLTIIGWIGYIII